jgi:hypothetical protein
MALFGHGRMVALSLLSGPTRKSHFRAAVMSHFNPRRRRDDPAVRSHGALGNWDRSALTEASRYL